MKKFEEATMSMAELERSREQWFLVAGRPIKKAGSLLDRAKAGEIKLFGGMTITRNTQPNDIDMVDDEEEDNNVSVRRRKTAVRVSKADQVLADMQNCHGITKYYIVSNLYSLNLKNISSLTHHSFIRYTLRSPQWQN